MLNISLHCNALIKHIRGAHTVTLCVICVSTLAENKLQVCFEDSSTVLQNMCASGSDWKYSSIHWRHTNNSMFGCVTSTSKYSTITRFIQSIQLSPHQLCQQDYGFFCRSEHSSEAFEQVKLLPVPYYKLHCFPPFELSSLAVHGQKTTVSKAAE